MSKFGWATGFLSLLESAFVGSPAASATPTTTVHTALQTAAQAAEAATTTIATAAKDTVDGYLTSKIGAVGDQVVDTGLQALIAEASSRLSSAQAPA